VPHKIRLLTYLCGKLAEGGRILQEIIDIIGKIANILTPLILISGVISAMTKKGKNCIVGWLRKINEPQGKAILCVLRSNVRNLCMDCICKNYITKEEWEDLTEAAEAYEGLGGNSSTHRLVERTLSLPVKNVGVE